MPNTTVIEKVPLQETPTVPRFLKGSRILAVVAVVLAVVVFLSADRHWLPCFLSLHLALVATLLVGLFALVFHVLGHRKVPLTWWTVATRVLLVLVVGVYALLCGIDVREQSKNGRSLVYLVFPGPLNYKNESCIETQLRLPFSTTDEKAYGFLFSNYIDNIRSDEGAARLISAARKDGYMFGTVDIMAATMSESEAMLDSVLRSVDLSERFNLSQGDMDNMGLPTYRNYPRLLAWIQWGTVDIDQKVYEVLLEYFNKHKVQAPEVTKVYYKDGNDRVLDLTFLGAVPDLPADFAWIPAHRILLAKGALQAANDQLTAMWASRVKDWAGPNPAKVALRELLTEIYGERLPDANSVATYENDSVVALQFTQPTTQTVDNENIQSVGLWRFSQLRDVRFTGTGIARNGSLVLYANGNPIQEVVLRNEKINGLVLADFSDLKDVDVSGLGLTGLWIEGDGKPLVKVAGNRICAPDMRKQLEEMGTFEGLDQQNCTARPTEWDTLIALADKQEEFLYNSDAEGDPATVVMDIPKPAGNPLWSEVKYIDHEMMETTRYRRFYADRVTEGPDAFFGAQFPPLLGGKLIPGMTREQVGGVLGLHYRGTGEMDSWVTDSMCGESFDGLRIGFDASGIIRWVKMVVPEGEC